MLKRDEFLSKVVSALGIEYKLMQNITTIVPRVTLIGASAGGKSTLANKCVIKFLSQLLMNNIESVQSSKIPSDIVLLWSKSSIALMNIKLKDNLDFDLIGKNIRKEIENLCISKSCYVDDDDIDKLLEDILCPEQSKAYDLNPILNLLIGEKKQDFLFKLRSVVEEDLNIVIEGNEISIIDKVNEEKKRAKKEGKKFSKAPIIKKLLDDRLSKLDLSNIFEILSNLYQLGLDRLNILVESLSQSLKSDDEYSILLDSNNLSELDKFMYNLYQNKGYCLIVDSITYYTPISEEVRIAFNRFSSLSKMNFKDNEPILVLQDLKGISDDISLEGGLLDNFKAMSSKQVDSCIVLHSLKNPMSFLVEPLKQITSYYSNLDINVLCTYADIFMTDNIRSLFKGVNGPGTDIDANNEEFYRYSVLKSVEKLETIKSEIEGRLKGVSNSDKIGQVEMCTLVPDYIKSIDEILSNNKYSGITKLYNYDSIYELLYDTCFRVKNRYKVCNPQYEDSVKIEVNEDKLKDLVCECIRRHNLCFEKEYYRYLNYNVHWNTVYAWRDKLRFGSGHTSNAEVYDNISIYLSSMVQGFISKADLLGLLNIKIDDGIPYDVDSKIREYIKQNLEVDFKNIKSQIGLSVTYTSLKSEFNQTYYKDALVLINKRLSSEEYWKKAIINSVLKVAEQMKIKTFR